MGHTALVPLARELAGVLTCGPDAVLSHHSAAALWGLRPDDPGDVHVTIGRGGSQSRPGLRVHRTRSLDAHDIRLRRGIPVTSPPRTIIDLADVLTERDLARTANEAEIRGLARRPELIAAVERSGPGRRGCALLREILRQNDPPTLTRSEAEERLLALITDAGLPRPEVNVRIQGHEVDALWRSSRLVVEVDGYAFHSTRAAFERDRARDGDLQAAGLRVLRVTWRHIVDAPYAVIARIAQALARASVATAATHPHAAPGRPRLRPSPR